MPAAPAKLMHNGVTAAFTKPVAMSAAAGMAAYAVCSMVACASPANMV